MAHLAQSLRESRRTMRSAETQATHSRTSDYIEPMRRANIERMLAARKNLGGPFQSNGAINRQRSRLFSQFDHKHDGGDLRPTVDHNGVPTQTHRGLTGPRSRSRQHGYPAVGLPHSNTRMDYTKGYEWMADAVREPHHPTNGYSRNRKWAQHTLTSDSHITPNGFISGFQAKPALFNPRAEPNAPDNSKEGPQSHFDWKECGVVHPHAFSSTSTANGAADGYVGRHPEFPYRPSEFKPREEIYQATTNAHGPGSGFRHGTDVRGYSIVAAQHIPFLTGEPTRHVNNVHGQQHVSGTDRGSRFLSAVDQENLDYHRSQRVRAASAGLSRVQC